MKELVKDAIANSFVELAAEKPFKQTTIKDILTKCGISKQTFYNYFRDKYDLMNYVYLSGVEAVIAQVGGYHADMQKAGQGAAELCRGKRQYFLTISRIDEQNSFSEYYYQHTYDYYVRRITHNFGKEALTKEVIAALEFNCSGTQKLFVDWVRKGMIESPEYISKVIFRSMPDILKPLLLDTVEDLDLPDE